MPKCPDKDHFHCVHCMVLVTQRHTKGGLEWLDKNNSTACPEAGGDRKVHWGQLRVAGHNL